MTLEPEEEAALKAFEETGPPEKLEKLRPLETFLLCLLRIPRFQLKLESLTVVRNAPALISGASVEVSQTNFLHSRKWSHLLSIYRSSPLSVRSNSCIIAMGWFHCYVSRCISQIFSMQVGTD